MSETNEKSSQFLFIDESSKGERATRILSEMDIEILCSDSGTPLAVIVMDTFD